MKTHSSLKMHTYVYFFIISLSRQTHGEEKRKKKKKNFWATTNGTENIQYIIVFQKFSLKHLKNPII